MNNFITKIIDKDIKRNPGKEVVLRFPPEPNGRLHLGHAKAMVLNSELANLYGGKLYLRLDDTNPETESIEFANGIIEDSKWLLKKEVDCITYTSDYFEKIFRDAISFIERGLAYVDMSSEEKIKKMRNGFVCADTPSKFRSATVKENLARFLNMKNGNVIDGGAVLRAKIDLGHANMNMRDPIMYRVKKATHYRTGDAWCVYPMYSYAHPVSDVIEEITYSLCTLEFEDMRVLYNWYVANTSLKSKWRPMEIEFARLNIDGVELSKRKLSKYISETGLAWDGKELPTLSGMRNRGYESNWISDFIKECGYSKKNTVMEEGVLESFMRNVCASSGAKKINAILNPVMLRTESGSNKLEVMIERSDIREKEEIGFWRVFPGNRVRLKECCNILVKCISKDGSVIAEIDSSALKPRAAIRWLGSGVEVDLRLYGALFDDDGNVKAPTLSKKIMVAAPLIADSLYEFEKVGYFYVDKAGVVNHLVWMNHYSCEGAGLLL